jgi:heme-degrading monooxygenase HmoA
MSADGQEEAEMYALVVTVAITDFDRARQDLQDRVSEIKQQPGFVGGYWLAPVDGTGMSVTAYETEDAAKEAEARMQPGTRLNDFVTVASVQRREVVANL